MNKSIEELHELLKNREVTSQELIKESLELSHEVQEKYNAFVTISDGIYVDGSCFLSGDQYDLLTKFSYKNGELLYDNVIVSREYQDNAVYDTVTAVWAKLDAEDAAIAGGETTWH